MNKLFILLLSIFIFGCKPDVGTIKEVSQPNSNIEVFKYWVEEDERPIYIARFKDQPMVQTTTQTYGKWAGKIRTTETQVTILFENDSIIIIKK